MPNRRHKYNARKVTVDGITFDSAKEARRYGELKLLQAAGEISGLKLQPVFAWTWEGEPLRYPRTKTGRKGQQIKYIADFKYFDRKRGKRVVEDVKGMDLQEGRIKRAVTEKLFNVEIEIV
jgi:hypothetical protein